MVLCSLRSKSAKSAHLILKAAATHMFVYKWSSILYLGHLGRPVTRGPFAVLVVKVVNMVMVQGCFTRFPAASAENCQEALITPRQLLCLYLR